jgi:hypothetical protein
MGRGDGGWCRRRQESTRTHAEARRARGWGRSGEVRPGGGADDPGSVGVSDRGRETTGSCRGGRRSSVFRPVCQGWTAWGPCGSMPAASSGCLTQMHHRGHADGTGSVHGRCADAHSTSPSGTRRASAGDPQPGFDADGARMGYARDDPGSHRVVCTASREASRSRPDRPHVRPSARCGAPGV